jgi:glucose 1-dehydrogenase
MRDRVAVVTGGESGIGAATARALSAAGARLAITYYRDADAAAGVARDCGGEGRAVAVQADVADEGAVDALFAAAETAFGAPATLLVNCAGQNMSGVRLADMALAQFDRVLRSDLYGPFLTCRRMVRGLNGAKGRIVNVSSIHERAPRVGGADYDAAKGGLRQLTATLALELAGQGVNVNGVAPGMILTPMNQRAQEDAGYRRALEANVPWGRAGTAEEVAGLILFLLGDAADYVTGTTVTMDGGLTLVQAQGA